MKFIELGLNSTLLENIEKANYFEPTPIQSMIIPHILNNEDVIGIAQTGTGKTAAFTLPIIEKLMQIEKPIRNIKALILCPTRELALQTRDNIRTFTLNTPLKCSVILGGVNQKSQIEVLKAGVDILVATPGRLLDLVKQRQANLSNVQMLVLDEADTMLDMGFIHDVKEIITKIPSNHQTMLFSATMSEEIKKVFVVFLKNPITISATPQATPVSKIKQLLYFVDKNNKSKLLLDLLKDSFITSALIFTRTKHGANKLEQELAKSHIEVSVIHGNKSQNNRVKALKDFKSGKNKIMIATDIAARGIDIDNLSHVINYDMPEQAEIYVHRIGRTARKGLEGTSLSFCNIDEQDLLKDIEKLIKQKIEVVTDHQYPMVILEKTPKKSTTRGKRPTSHSKPTTNNIIKKNIPSVRFKQTSRPSFNRHRISNSSNHSK